MSGTVPASLAWPAALLHGAPPPRAVPTPPTGRGAVALAVLITLAIAALLVASALFHAAPAGSGALAGLHFLCRL